MTRRDFLRTATLAAAPTLVRHRALAASPLISSIAADVLIEGRSGKHPSWFHPRACIIPGPLTNRILMTMQEITGSDAFSPVQFVLSDDLGAHWTEPQPVNALGRLPAIDGVEEGVCDVVPEWHPQTQSVLALGHNVFYRKNIFFKDQPSRRPVYAVWKDGQWGPRNYLEWNDPRGSYIYSNNCGQRVVMPDGRILLAFTYGTHPSKPRSVSGVICTFDGQSLRVDSVGEEIKGDAGRGLLEPSVTNFANRYFLTIRAEDGRGYVCSGTDGLNWTARKAWSWDDGSPIGMSSTQQHWVTHSDGLFLAYTRSDTSNSKVMRWRSPLWISQVDPDRLHLIRETEQILIPMTGDGVNAPKSVPLMGNFHITNVSSTETWVTDGEAFVGNNWRGNLNRARIRWEKPNQLIAKP